MDDDTIMDLYWDRSDAAISETAVKYGSYCYSIAYHILMSSQEAEESVRDTWLAAWNAMPPRRPSILAAFLGKITRCLSIDRWQGGGEMELALEELDGVVADSGPLENRELRRSLNRFVEDLSETERKVFLCRYWYLDSTAEVAELFGFSESKVKSMLLRTRGKLRAELEKEGLL